MNGKRFFALLLTLSMLLILSGAGNSPARAGNQGLSPKAEPDAITPVLLGQMGGSTYASAVQAIMSM